MGQRLEGKLSSGGDQTDPEGPAFGLESGTTAGGSWYTGGADLRSAQASGFSNPQEAANTTLASVSVSVSSPARYGESRTGIVRGSRHDA